MRIVELIIDENDEYSGVDAISLVESPAISENWVALNKDTVKRASELYLKKGHANNATYEHIQEVQNVSLVESWIVEDKINDKSALYNLDLPIGTWVGAMKIENEELWKMAKVDGTIKGFSIEGYFEEKAKLSTEKETSLNKDINTNLSILLNRLKTIENGK